MKKVLLAVILPLVVAGGIVFANGNFRDDDLDKPAPKPMSAAEREAIVKQWESTPGGIAFKNWEASAAGKKVYAAEAIIRQNLREYTDMEAVVTSLSLPPGSRLGFGIMTRIKDEDYIVTFDADKSQLPQLKSLQVGETLIIRSRTVSHAPKYAYPIIVGDYAEREGKMIFKRVQRKGGC